MSEQVSPTGLPIPPAPPKPPMVVDQLTLARILGNNNELRALQAEEQLKQLQFQRESEAREKARAAAVQRNQQLVASIEQMFDIKLAEWNIDKDSGVLTKRE